MKAAAKRIGVELVGWLLVVAGIAAVISIFLQEVPLRGRAELGRRSETEPVAVYGK